MEKKSKKAQDERKVSLLYFSKFYDVFESIESRLSYQGPEIDVFTMGSIKSEVKEEMFVKSEGKVRAASFSEVLSIIKPIALQIYKYQY